MKTIYKICVIFNMLLILYLTILIALVGMNIINNAASFFGSSTFRIILNIFLFPSMFLLYKNNVICYKKDTIERGLLLFFCHLFYNPFYSIRVFKKGWLND